MATHEDCYLFSGHFTRGQLAVLYSARALRAEPLAFDLYSFAGESALVEAVAALPPHVYAALLSWLDYVASLGEDERRAALEDASAPDVRWEPKDAVVAAPTREVARAEDESA